MSVVASNTDCVIEYLKVLHEYGVDSPEATEFKQQHKDDQTFQRRAKAAELLYRHRDQILEELQHDDGDAESNSLTTQEPVAQET